MSVSDEQITKVFKARRTVMQMLRDRGYSVSDSDINMTRQQFVEKFGENIHLKREDLLILCNKGDAPTDQMYVFFFTEEKVGVPIVRNCAKRMKADNVYNAILVVQRALTAPAKAAIVEINSYFHMEVFEEAELLTNITEHMFVPKHTVLKDHEKKELLQKYRVKETQLPRILVSDPVAKYYGMRRGQVVKITRQSVTADTYDTYRYAV
ncbi:DNA-directed RNA polymerase subunit 5-like protein 1 [Hibiscus syriacus]|uniref:DNA-directed RNA polymerase subunit 5-like protein 1 n=1 Tax=Hibiscus syriacus TaxID=106335 RepID=A0A6A3BXF9_HIBSY|nr:DNA-directed RNA polymerases II and IV subunit 5A-like [Hibiscus syriacus]KAE8719682.1 DNA-directed RNA polymerase subunit 5-like protein 1 [Hibiscus syriacus]